MKINSIYRSKNERKPDVEGDIIPRKYSKDPIHHPMLIEREYVRALNATKIERMFAKPFVAALSYHREGINHLVKSFESNTFASASYDNQVILWDLRKREIIKKLQFDNIINGIALDKKLNVYVSQEKSVIGNDNEYKSSGIVNSIALSDANELGVATTKGIEVFDLARFTPKTSHSSDGASKIVFNESLKHIMAGIASMNVNLYDNRSCKPFATVNTELATSIKFNPQQGHMFAVGREDGDSMLYDIRQFDSPVNTFRGHVNAVVCLAFNPNGQELATGSFDRTIRIFNTDARKSRDCYYNDRMQLVHGVEYSNDGQYIISGSDDGSLRIWKSKASKKLGPLSKSEKEAMRYNETLKEKFRNVSEVSRISKHRFLPSLLKQEMKRHHEKFEARIRKQNKREEKRRAEEENED